MGMGTKAKEVMDPKPLFTVWMMPFAPPMNKKAATKLPAQNANATGTPTSMKINDMPNKAVAAQYHSKFMACSRFFASTRQNSSHRGHFRLSAAGG